MVLSCSSQCISDSPELFQHWAAALNNICCRSISYSNNIEPTHPYQSFYRWATLTCLLHLAKTMYNKVSLVVLLRWVKQVHHRKEQQSLHSPQILVLWICRWTVEEEERIQPYYPWGVFFIVPSLKKVPTARTERRAGYASGVVKCSCRGINHGRFIMCWKSSWVILPFALPLFPRSMRIDTVHCMPEARNEWHQRSACIHKLMMVWQSKKY